MSRNVVVWRRARMFVAALLYLVAYHLVGGPDLYCRIWWSRLWREPPPELRARIASWPSRWMRIGSWFFRRLGGMRLRFVWHGNVLEARGPFIIIMNHFGVIDGMIVADALHRLHCHDARPIAMPTADKLPLIGLAWKLLDVAFVRRSGTDSRAAIRRMCRTADEDGASIYICPEGTILTAARAEHGAGTLLDAHYTGLVETASAQPTRPGLSLTTYWCDWAPWRLSDAGILPPATDAVVEVRVLPPPGDKPYTWLAEEWLRKRQWLQRMHEASSGDA